MSRAKVGRVGCSKETHQRRISFKLTVRLRIVITHPTGYFVNDIDSGHVRHVPVATAKLLASKAALILVSRFGANLLDRIAALQSPSCFLDGHGLHVIDWAAGADPDGRQE